MIEINIPIKYMGTNENELIFKQDDHTFYFYPETASEDIANGEPIEDHVQVCNEFDDNIGYLSDFNGIYSLEIGNFISVCLECVNDLNCKNNEDELDDHRLEVIKETYDFERLFKSAELLKSQNFPAAESVKRLIKNIYPDCLNYDELIEILKANYYHAGVTYQNGFNKISIYAATVAHFCHNVTNYDDDFIYNDEREEMRREENRSIKDNAKLFLGI